MASGAQQLLEAIKALYGHPDDKVKRQAGEWLEQWQQSVEAWSVSDSVLHDRSCTIDAHYFCAQTLRTKIKRDFEELPSGAVSSLRDSLMDLLLHYGEAGPLVRIQLCLAFAALVVHVPSEQWGQGGAVQWLLNRLQGKAAKASVSVMLDMLILLPEEANTYAPSVRPERRRQMQEEMVNSAPMALQVLASCLSGPGAQTPSQVLEAFAAWLALTPGAGLPGAQLAQHPLTTATLEGLAYPETFDKAVDAMVELIYSTSRRGEPDQDSLALVSRLVPAVIGLTPRFARSCRVAQAEAQGLDTDNIPGADEADDEDTMKGMARLFAEVGEAFTAMIASGSQDAMKPVEALLEVASHPDAEICSISFNFWHRLARQLNSAFSSTTASPQDTEAEQQRRKAPFYPAFSKLVTLIQGRVRYPDDWEKLPDDEKRSFKHDRYDVSDTLLDAASVLGAQKILEILVGPLQSLSQPGSTFDWQTAEAALQCIRSVSSEVAGPNQPLVIALLQSLPQLPAVPRLQYTAALTLGNFSGWIASALDSGQLSDTIPQLLQMLTAALASPESAQAASQAFRDICDACGSRLVPHLEALMRLYQSVQSAGTMSNPASKSSLDEEGVLQIMEAVALLISTLPEAQRRASLNTMLQPVVQSLQQTLHMQQQQKLQAKGTASTAASSQPPTQVLALFDRLTAILRYVNDSGAVTEALVQIWPLVEAALQLYSANATAVEQICRTPRYALRTAGKLAQTGSIVATMMAAVPRWFRAAPHSSFLYLASELVKTFGDVSRQEGALAELLSQLLDSACSRLMRLQQFNEQPDLADDTFLLASRVLSHSPKLLLNNPQLISCLLDSAQAGILVQHRDAGDSVMGFLHKLFKRTTLELCSKEAAQQLLNNFVPKGPTIFRLLLAGAAGYLSFSRLDSISETLTSLLQATHEQGAQWLGQAVSLLPKESAGEEDKSKLLQVTVEVASRDESKSRLGAMDNALHELHQLVSRNKRSLEAAENALLPAELKQALW